MAPMQFQVVLGVMTESLETKEVKGIYFMSMIKPS